MTKRATAVIGANFGDEGKGLMTDYFCRDYGPRTVVVRFNGGAQAGHTVDHGHGRRHVFQHFGAGTLRGAQTYLSRFFIANPILMEQEARELARFGHRPIVAIDGSAPLSTPYDMLLNQAAETARGENRHGSCGVGINETVHRMENGFATFVADTAAPKVLRCRLEEIRDTYVPARLEQLGIADVGPDMKRFLSEESLVGSFLSSCEEFRRRAEIVDEEYLRHSPFIVFEGAQGLLLDEDHRFFPHVTRSKTGLANVMALAETARVDEIEAVYVTRAYVTRHGAGPFPCEDTALSYQDDTNVPHPFQQSLRFGWLNLDLLNESIRLDLAYGARRGNVRPRLAVTHLDQMKDFYFYAGGKPDRCASDSDFLRIVTERLDISRGYASYGPKASDVQAFLALKAANAA